MFCNLVNNTTICSSIIIIFRSYYFSKSLFTGNKVLMHFQGMKVIAFFQAKFPL